MTTTGDLIVAVDGSADSDRAIEWAVSEGRSSGARLVLTHCLPYFLPEVDGAAATIRRDAGDKILDEASELARSLGCAAVSVHRLEPHGLEVWGALVRAARAQDTLVLGARGHSRLAGILTGSVSQQVTRGATGTVVVVRAPADESATRVLVGLDESGPAQDALEWTLERATRTGGVVTALRAWRGPSLHGSANVLPVPEDAPARHVEHQAALEAELAPWRGKYPAVRIVGESIPGHAGQVLATASEHASLVVVGTPRRTAHAQAVLGSVTQAVLHLARCPVAVVR